MSSREYGYVPTENEIRERRYKISSSALTIGERHRGVEEVMINIVGACNKDMIGKQYAYSKEMQAFFFIDCHFSECYGYEKGFYLNKEIEDMTSKHEHKSHTRVSCGGSGNRSLQFGCDNYLDIDIIIQYL